VTNASPSRTKRRPAIVSLAITGLPIDQRDRSAQALSPERALIGLAGFSRVPEGPERASGIDLLGASVSRLDRNQSHHEKRRLEQP
jgi:hypothetical protein